MKPEIAKRIEENKRACKEEAKRVRDIYASGDLDKIAEYEADIAIALSAANIHLEELTGRCCDPWSMFPEEYGYDDEDYDEE